MFNSDLGVYAAHFDLEDKSTVFQLLEACFNVN